MDTKDGYNVTINLFIVLLSEPRPVYFALVWGVENLSKGIT